MTAVILAAGTGTRLRPMTDTIPKALVPVGGMPMLEIVIRRLTGAGYNRLIINLHHFSGQVRDFISSHQAFGTEILFSDETDQLLDTGGALRKMQHLLAGEEEILIHNVDILTNLDYQKLAAAHRQSDTLATLAVKQRPTSRSLLIDRRGLLCGWEYPERHIRICTRESQKGLSSAAYSGISVLSPKIFGLLPEEEVFGFMPWILNLASTEKISTWDQSPAFWYEVGRPDSLEQASRELSFDPSHPDFLIRK